MTGTEIGNYRILEKLGEGGMGVVYKAVDTSLDRIVAIKVLNGDLARVPELVARFRGEARAQANLNHTNLATLYAFLTVGDNAMMVMEFVDGETFAQMIRRRGPLPAQGSVPMFRQALLGFAYAHRAGIVHRDIKPSNLMLNHHGIAKVMGERGLTRTGMQVGTSRYMSPEQVLNKEADIRSDIYALGITLYEMLTANTPFQGDSEFHIMSDHVHTPPPPPSRFYPYIPRGVENAVLKALAKNPDERFQTAEEFGAALERPDDFGIAGAAVAAVLPPPLPYGAPGQTTWPATATMPVAGPAAVPPPPQYHTPFPQYQAAPPQYQTPPPQYQAPPPYQTPPPQMPAPAPAPATGLGALVATWPGRIVVAGITALILLMGGWLLLRPAPPQPLPAAIAPQVSGSQVLNPTPNPERVNIEMSNKATPALQVQAFEAAPNPVRPGQRVTLSWAVPGATEVTINPSIGTVPAQGSRVISARAGTQFTLTAKAADGQTVSRTLDVRVDSGSAARPSSAQQTRAANPAPQQQTQAPVQTAPPPRQATPVPPAPQPVPQQAPPQQVRASPVMNLFHDHGVIAGRKFLWPSCWGQMQIGGGRVVYRVLGTSDGRRDDFVVPVSAVQEVMVNRVPIRGHQAFHMRINGQIFNFVPASGSPVLFVNVIQQWLQEK
jgi:serine/threonine-protein kinase